MTSPGEPEQIELLVPTDGETASAPDRVTTRPLLLSSRWAQLAAVVGIAGLLALVLGIGQNQDDGENEATGDRSGVQGDAVLDDGDVAGGDGAATTLEGDAGAGAAPPQGPGDAARELRHRLDELDGRTVLAMSSPVGITLWDLAGGQTSLVPLPEAPAGDGLVPLGDRLVYVGETAAWSVAEDGDGRIVGQADEVRVAGDPDLVWLGTSLDEDAEVSYFGWSEVTVEGVETRHTRREMPLEFQSPDLVWGFNSSLFRLTSDEDRPWQLMMYGAPLAVGPNDLIAKTCDPDCRRVWLDAATGADRGPLLADVSTRFEGQRGWLSPDGRFVAFQQGSAAKVQVIGLGLDVERSLDCRSARELVWAANGLAVCRTDAGVAVIDLVSGGSMTVVPPANLYGVALWMLD